jgi:hypothetical protein
MTGCKSVFKIREITHRVCQNTLSVFLLKLFMILKSRDSYRSQMNEEFYTVWVFHIYLLFKMEIFWGHLLCGVIGGSHLLQELYLGCLECSIAAVRVCVTEIIYVQW